MPRAATNAAICFLLLAALASHAGDILRGGAPMGASKSRTSTGSTAGSSTANALQTNARDRLSRTTSALDSVKALQQAARNSAAANARLTYGGAKLPLVPDGLRPGGLQVDPRVPKNLNKPKAGDDASLWIGAKLPTQTSAKGGAKNVVIVQTDQQAILNWKTFNVGKKTTLTFDQSKGGSDASKWIAFNKVNDPKAKPSQILGQIKAQGQVYILNQNGIIFGNNSQVNVHTLTASALPINPSLITSGLLNNPDAQFLFNAVESDELKGDILDAQGAALSQLLDSRSALRIVANISVNKKVGTSTTTTTSNVHLTEGKDYTLVTDKNRQTFVVLTDAGRIKTQGDGTPDVTVTINSVAASYSAQTGNVIVERGAQLASPSSAAKVGGRIMLVGANVKNKGTISTPDGQTILAAGLQVGIAAHSGDDPSLRGLDVFVGQVADAGSKRIYAGTATNEGLIDIPRASATITGRSVQQDGFIDSTTSVTLNGRIDLLANYDALSNLAFTPDQPNGGPFVYQSTGVVTLGKDSVMRILPEWSSDESVAASELSDAQRSQINIQGLATHLDTGSTLWAPNAKVSVKAGTWNYIPASIATAKPVAYEFVYGSGQIYVDQKATIDVAGSTAVSVPLDQNILTLQLRGAELADSPLQRDGPLRAVNIVVDARETGTFNGREWIGTPLGDATGFEGLIERGIGQLTTMGGSVDFQAGGSVVVQRDSLIDVSGGYFNNIGGLVKTTKVVQGSRLVDIADATPDQIYDGIYDPKFIQTHAKWGVARTYRNPLSLDGAHYEADYIQGANGGSISIVAPSMAIQGKLAGNTVVGPKQLRKNASTSTLADEGKLSLTFKSQNPDPGFDLNPYSTWTSNHAPTVVFDNASLPKPLAFALDAEGSPLAFNGDSSANLVDPFQLRTKLRDTLNLSPDLLTTGGFGTLTVDNSAGDISVPEMVALTAPTGGEIAFKARNIDVQGSISAPGGKLAFTAYNVSPYETDFLKLLPESQIASIVLPTAKTLNGRFTLGSTATLSTAGTVLDDRSVGDRSEFQPIAMDGGSVGITAYTANLNQGSLVDVSGGVLMNGDNQLSYGNGGSISVLAGLDADFVSLLPKVPKDVKKPDFFVGGRLWLGGELRGFAGGKGGSLALQAPAFQIGGVRATDAVPGTVYLNPDFFNQGGFTSFALTGIGGTTQSVGGFSYLPAISIAENTEIAPHATSLLATPTGADGLSLSHILLQPGLRTPVSLSFTGRELGNILQNNALIIRSDVVMGSGSVIRTEASPDVSVSFSGDTVAILGSVYAPGGDITIKGGTNSLKLFGYAAGKERPTPTVYISSQSVLSAAGTTILTPDPYGRRLGSVLSGGSVSVAGNIVAASGAVLDVSGTSGVFDLSPLEVNPDASRTVALNSGITAPLDNLRTVPTKVDSDGGSITLAGGEELFSDATLRGQAGGPSALGGSLSVSSGRFILSGSAAATSASALDSTLLVTQSTNALPTSSLPSLFGDGEQTAIGHPVLARDGSVLPGLGRFAVDTFTEGGFDSLDLSGTVRFLGPVDINARGSVKVADSGVLYANDAVKISASYVALGMAFQTPQLPDKIVAPFTFPSNPFNFAPNHGPGTLEVDADLIDIGTLSLRNMRFANFIARDGDIRGDGTLNIAGRLRFEAGQIYTPTALSFTAVAYDYRNSSGKPKPGQEFLPGSIVIKPSGTRQLPLSAGGTLSFYASNIEQSGVLRAPMGTINLGWNGTGTAPTDPIVGSKRAFPVTQKLLLGAGSVTSVSTIDPVTGEGTLIPYGVSLDGNSWIDPRGVDVTASGLPSKSVSLSADRVITKNSSTIDLRGGGDLYAYRFVPGNGGSQDILASDGSFAVLPDYNAAFAPIGAFNTDSAVTTFNRDPQDVTTRDAGYVNNALSIGDRVYLGASDGLSAGFYTLLPARYALLPGAFLVTPKSGTPGGTLSLPGGVNVVAGYRSNGLDPTQGAPSVYSRFEVISQDVVRQRAQYDDFSANRFIRDTALAGNAQPQLLPIDAGHLSFQGTETLRLNGAVLGQAPFGGRGAFIDVSSPADIIIAGADTNLSKKQTKDAIVLNAAKLSAWNAESLLIGGIRRDGEDGATVSVDTANLTVDNAGSLLTGPEIILVADKTLTLAPHAEITQSGYLTGHAENLLLDGDGTMLRVSSDADAAYARTNVTGSHDVNMRIGAGAHVSAISLTLDSSYGTDLSPQATLRGHTVNLASGQISIALSDPGEVLPTDGLVLAGRALRGLRGADALSLLSYTSIDIYGSGELGSSDLDDLGLHAGEIRGFNNARGVTLAASHVTLDNKANGKGPGSVAAATGSLKVHAKTLELGAHRLDVDQFSEVGIRASGGVLLGAKGKFFVDGDLDITTPSFFAVGGAIEDIRAAGELRIAASSGKPDPSLSSGLGASLTLQGASVTANADVLLPSGQLTLHATSGNVNVNGRLDVGGTAQQFNDLVKYTSGGSISLLSDQGDVNLGKSSALFLAAQKGGGDAGSLTIAATGLSSSVNLDGELFGQGGKDGHGGSFSLDVGALPTLGKLSAVLADASFTESQSFRVRHGDVVVGGTTSVRDFSLSTDEGSITITGKIDASGDTGGKISLLAHGDVVLADGSVLDASGKDFSNAGKGGAISLEAGSETDGVAGPGWVDIRSGSKIDLSVASANASSESLGQFTGTLHLRAPQNAAGNDLQVRTIGGDVKGASVIIAEGYRIYDLSGGTGEITSSTKGASGSVKTDAQNFIGAAGQPATASYTAMFDRLVGTSGLGEVLSIRPGAEIINTSGDLLLGLNASSRVDNDWNLETFRFGPDSAPGVLTLRASGNLVFNNALQDGFAIGTTYNAAYQSALVAYNPLLPANAQSWTFRLVAGADFSAADFHRVLPLTGLAADSGSLLLGKNNDKNAVNSSSGGSGEAGGVKTTFTINRAITGGSSAASNPNNRYQVIRTGSGDIDIATGRDVQLLNQFATIYTAGTRVADPSLGGTFDLPNLTFVGSTGLTGSALGPPQQSPQAPIQYSLGGGDVTIHAQNDIARYTTIDGVQYADSSRELPTNWLYRRGSIDPATGEFKITATKGNPSTGLFVAGDAESTTWWVDFTNFFEGVGALGGGDVTVTAGRDVANIDAVIPTNARMPKGKPDASALVELGGGDLVVTAGRNIDAGVYYVERGHGTLEAGKQITTNATRSPSLGLLNVGVDGSILSEQTWLPTTLFLGKGGFDVSARGDILLGPVVNASLQPTSLNNGFGYKTYFSTYSASSYVEASSLGGDVTLRTEATIDGSAGSSEPLLQAWLQTQSLLVATSGSESASFYQPWLRLDETSVGAFRTASALMAPTLRATAFTGDINLQGSLTLSPASKGTLELAAGGALNGLQANGTFTINGVANTFWDTSVITVSDASPGAIPGVASPFAYENVAGIGGARTSTDDFLTFLDVMFQETGATNSVLQTKQALHAPGPLHADDPNPLRLYSLTGDISGLTLFSPKAARVVAGQDITDVALYIQNIDVEDISVVAAGRDLVPYTASSILRAAATAPGNVLNPVDLNPLAGDIQLSGPGALEVLAGHNLDLGTGSNNPDGTGAGITTVGNARNPYLPSDGASIIAGAGIGPASSLDRSALDFEAFEKKFLLGDDGEKYLKEVDPTLTPEIYAALPEAQRDRVALDAFYLILRDAGRSQTANDGSGGYAIGFAAIKELFPTVDDEGKAFTGDINTRARDIRTKSGGDISLFAPAGKLTLATSVIGSPLAPPGVVTESGGNVSVFTNGNVDIGISRIFTLRGGNEIIWSSTGDIAAGSSAKTVKSAPPTRVLIDPQSADVQTDLAGLATGGGIGVLATVEGVPPGDVDLIAPVGVVNAGDAGIRVSGNLNIAATAVLNASNITVLGQSTGVPSAPVVAAPNIAGLTNASNVAGAANSAAESVANQARQQAAPEESPSIITVDVVGYGGGSEGESQPDTSSALPPDAQSSVQQMKSSEAAARSSLPSEIQPAANRKTDKNRDDDDDDDTPKSL